MHSTTTVPSKESSEGRGTYVDHRRSKLDHLRPLRSTSKHSSRSGRFVRSIRSKLSLKRTASSVVSSESDNSPVTPTEIDMLAHQFRGIPLLGPDSCENGIKQPDHHWKLFGWPGSVKSQSKKRSQRSAGTNSFSVPSTVPSLMSGTTRERPKPEWNSSDDKTSTNSDKGSSEVSRRSLHFELPPPSLPLPLLDLSTPALNNLARKSTWRLKSERAIRDVVKRDENDNERRSSMDSLPSTISSGDETDDEESLASIEHPIHHNTFITANGHSTHGPTEQHASETDEADKPLPDLPMVADHRLTRGYGFWKSQDYPVVIQYPALPGHPAAAQRYRNFLEAFNDFKPHAPVFGEEIKAADFGRKILYSNYLTWEPTTNTFYALPWWVNLMGMAAGVVDRFLGEEQELLDLSWLNDAGGMENTEFTVAGALLPLTAETGGA